MSQLTCGQCPHLRVPPDAITAPGRCALNDAIDVVNVLAKPPDCPLPAPEGPEQWIGYNMGRAEVYRALAKILDTEEGPDIVRSGSGILEHIELLVEMARAWKARGYP